MPLTELEAPVPVTHISIRSETDKVPGKDLLCLLGRLLKLDVRISPRSAKGSVGEIIPVDAKKLATPGGVPRLPSLQVPSLEPPVTGGALREIGVRFTDDPNVPFPFRGRTLRAKIAVQPEPLVLEASEKLLAGSDIGPVWSLCLEAGLKHFRSAFTLPSIPAEGKLLDVLNGERFLEVLPLLHWLRETSGAGGYEGPPLRACFIFDDPNLHWPSYGFVDYRQIAQQATRENYHVSFATIPLDSWFTHKPTAAIFKANASRLSLAMHGNNHTRQELAKRYGDAERSFLLRQALRRIERLERVAGVPVSRVMVPPHGACSEEMLADLPVHGFEAACISHGSLNAHNRSRPWVRTLGFAPSEVVRNCPVLPRWGFSSNTDNTLLLAAFLRQPLILRGHHEDLKAGIELLDRHARFINSLGSVIWSNLTDLSRMNYYLQKEGSVYRIKPLGRKVVLPMMVRPTQLIIEDSGTGCADNWQVSGMGGLKLTARNGEPVSLSERFDGPISLESAVASEPLAESLTTFPSAVVFARRLLTEGRDRLLS